MKLPKVKYLGQLTWLDVGLVSALILTALFWALTRNASPGLAAIDDVAWEAARENVVAAFDAGDLEAARAALIAAAAVAEPARDGAAEALIAFAGVLQGTGIADLDTALAALDRFPQSLLFADLYLAVWLPRFFPPFPSAPPAPGAEWLQASILASASPTVQYWGSTVWATSETPGTLAAAELAIPDLAFDGTLAIADEDEALLVSLAFTGLFDGAPVLDAVFSSSSAGVEAILPGTIETADGLVTLTVPPDGRDATVGMLQVSDEIRVAISFEGERRIFLRFQLGESGQAVIASAFPAAPATP